MMNSILTINKCNFLNLQYYINGKISQCLYFLLQHLISSQFLNSENQTQSFISKHTKIVVSKVLGGGGSLQTTLLQLLQFTSLVSVKKATISTENIKEYERIYFKIMLTNYCFAFKRKIFKSEVVCFGFVCLFLV